jgi:hypothetical protein
LPNTTKKATPRTIRPGGSPAGSSFSAIQVGTDKYAAQPRRYATGGILILARNIVKLCTRFSLNFVPKD